MLGAALTLVLAGQSAASQPDIFLLMGQSNMSGRGALAELGAPERLADPRVALFGNDGRWRPALEPLDAAAAQLDAVSADSMAGVGPGLFFARALAEATGRRVALVPCAKGGVSIRDWRPAAGRATLYGSCLARARKAGRRIAGVLWMQGESDARDPEAARWWPNAFRAFTAALRRDLARPGLPVAMAAIAEPTPDRARYPGWAALRRAQLRLSGRCVGVVAAPGPLTADRLHLTTAAQRVLGMRLAGAMAMLRRRPACAS